MLNIKILIIVIIALLFSGCAVAPKPTEVAIDIGCLDKCEYLEKSCLQRAEENNKLCTGNDCDEMLMDDKFKCISDKPICKSKCI